MFFRIEYICKHKTIEYTDEQTPNTQGDKEMVLSHRYFSVLVTLGLLFSFLFTSCDSKNDKKVSSLDVSKELHSEELWGENAAAEVEEAPMSVSLDLCLSPPNGSMVAIDVSQFWKEWGHCSVSRVLNSELGINADVMIINDTKFRIKAATTSESGRVYSVKLDCEVPDFAPQFRILVPAANQGLQCGAAMNKIAPLPAR